MFTSCLLFTVSWAFCVNWIFTLAPPIHSVWPPSGLNQLPVICYPGFFCPAVKQTELAANHCLWIVFRLRIGGAIFPLPICSVTCTLIVLLLLEACLMLYQIFIYSIYFISLQKFNPLKPELNPICYLLALLGAHHFLHVNRIRVKFLTLRWLMSYIYGAPILDVSRSHTTTQHSR